MTRRLAGFGVAFAMAELAAVCLPPLAVLPTAAFVVLVLGAACLRRTLRGYALPVLLGVLAGGVWFWGYHTVVVLPRTELTGQTVTALVVVSTDAEPSYQDGCLRGTLHIVEMSGEPCSIKVSCGAFPYAEPGDRFLATFSLQEITSGRYRQSWYAKGVFLEAEYLGDYEAREPSVSPVYVLYRLRQNLSRALCLWLPNDLGGIEAAVLLGDTSRLLQTVEEEFRTAGVSHLLAISGLHLSLLCGLLSRRDGRFRFFRPYLALQAVLVLFYMVFTGMSVSVLRAGILVLITLAGYALLQPPDLLTSLGLAAVLISFSNAYAPCDMGFQLSFCGVLGVQLGAALSRCQKKILLPEAEAEQRNIRRRLLQRLLNLAETVETASLATLATLPVLLAHGLSAGGAAIPANLLTVWMLRPALILGILVLLASSFSWLVPLYRMFSLLLSLWLSWMYALVRWCANLPVARLYLPREYTLLVWCVLALLAFVFWARHRLLWYGPTAAICLLAAVCLGARMQQGVLRVLLAGTSGNACTVLIRDGQAVVLFRGGAANLNAVRDCLADNGDPDCLALIDLRQDPKELDFSGADTVVALEEQSSASSSLTLENGMTVDCFTSSGGNACVVQLGDYRIGTASGQPELASTVYVDLFCAAGSLPESIQARTVLTNSTEPRWLEEENTLTVYAGEDPEVVIRLGTSVVFKEGEILAVQ